MKLNTCLNGIRSRLRFQSFARSCIRRNSLHRLRLPSYPPPISACVEVFEGRILLTAPVLIYSTYLGGSNNVSAWEPQL